MEDIDVNVSFADVVGEEFKFTKIRSLSDFVKTELEFWTEQAKHIDTEGKENGKQNKHPFFACVNTFNQVRQSIDNWLPDLQNQSRDQINQHIRAINQQLQNLRQSWLWSGNPACHKLVELQLEHGVNAAHGFVEIVLKNALKIDSHDAFIGTMAGYEFSFQNSEILKRRNSEKTAFDHLRRSLSEAKRTLIEEVETFKSDYADWDAETRHSAERLYTLTKKLGKRKLRHQDKTFQDRLHDWSQSITDLESTYEEKLRLETPAKYWKNSADKYRGQGKVWVTILLIALSLGLVTLSLFFIHWLEGKELGLSLNSLQGIVIFGTFGAVFAYLIRVLSKLSFSSFHLMRDAEEREQLTYLYLSLTKEAEMNKESRDLVLQALFSRTDSGLLAGDSSPTMPSAADALRVLSKTRSP